jgi:hypothetical protein
VALQTVELEDLEYGHRWWTVMEEDEVTGFIEDNCGVDVGLSDVDSVVYGPHLGDVEDLEETEDVCDVCGVGDWLHDSFNCYVDQDEDPFPGYGELELELEDF